jgi:aminopeptidase N
MLKLFYFLFLLPILFLSACFSQADYTRILDEKRKEMGSSGDVNKSISKAQLPLVESQKFPTKTIDILHTDLKVKFDFIKHECIGEAIIQLQPHFYPTDSIVLDAHQMIIDGVRITDQAGNAILHEVSYNQHRLKLFLERELKAAEIVTLKISYIARPDLQQAEKGKAIRDDKGLYFINTRNEELNKPIQIWTQGETEANSCWFPTLDNPNEKFTSTLTISVDSSFTILSNGKREWQKVEANIKTEKWINDKPMSAYLVMMAIGKFSIIKEMALGKEVSYYLEEPFAPYAKLIFAHTPEMISFYSEKLGVTYPWDKYAQVVVRDYVSGAMENTSATLHGEFVQKNDRQLVDGNNDDIVAHELFHQWFGDLVTCESWSQLVLNEGFATYGEWLWHEHKYGKDAFLEKAHKARQRYLRYTANNPILPIVNYHYKKADDMFNTITYQKGAMVLNLLRHELGDRAFFTSLKNYLTKYSFANAKVLDLQQEFETVSGKDLHSFFKQWFYEGEHPHIQVRYTSIDSNKTILVQLEQKQTEKLFTFPIEFKVRHGNQTEYNKFEIASAYESFYVKRLDTTRSDLPDIYIDPNATFVGKISEIKSIVQTLNMYMHAENYIDKIRAIEELGMQQTQYDTARVMLLTATNDMNASIRSEAIRLLDWTNAKNQQQGYEILRELALHDVSSTVRVNSLKALGNIQNADLKVVYLKAIHDSSYTAAASALSNLYKLDALQALQVCATLQMDAKGELFEQIVNIYTEQGDKLHTSFFINKIPSYFKSDRVLLIESYKDLILRLGLPFEETQQAISIFQTRAKLQESTWVRQSAITALDDIFKAYKTKLDMKAEEKDLQRQLSESLQQILLIETDESVLDWLKERGIKATE